jgi:hypothetical protein
MGNRIPFAPALDVYVLSISRLVTGQPVFLLEAAACEIAKGTKSRNAAMMNQKGSINRIYPFGRGIAHAASLFCD